MGNQLFTSDTTMIGRTKTKKMVFTNYKSGEHLKLGTREIKTIEFHKSELEKIPAELLDHKKLQNLIFSECRFTHLENLERLKVCQNLIELTLEKCNLQTFPDFLSELYTLETLNMSGNLFKEGLPDHVINLRCLESLIISRCMLQQFPLVLNKLRTLKRLCIQNNGNIGSLSESLEKLTTLETLIVGDCGLSEFPQVLCKLKTLKELNIGSNNIQNLPGTLQNLTNLETLKVDYCGLSGFPEVLCKLRSLKALEIKGNQDIQNLPDALDNLANLQTLDVSKCGLKGFPQALSKLTSLIALDIGWNSKVGELSSTLENLTNLETLDVSGCGLKEFPQVLCKLKSLKALRMGYNGDIQNLPRTLGNLTNLETLDVWNCGLKEFPQVLCKLKSLKVLRIGYNGIQNLPSTLENLTNLETLDVWNCGSKEFPQVLCKLKSLKALRIGFNGIQNLPSTLKNLTNLETLDVSGCGLKEFPQVLCKLKSLKSLDIGYNDIQNLPGTLKNLTNLETLDVWKCDFKEFPQVLCKLKLLKALRIGYDGIQNLPSTLQNLTNLETLDVWNCGLKEFPQVLCKLKSLKSLHIGYNDIQNLPSTLKNLTNLETLDVSGCGFKEFPQVLCKLESLKALRMGYNGIQNLPSALENLTNLETLDVSDCGLKEFPQVLCKLKLLQFLYVPTNQFKEIPSIRFTFEMERLHILDVSDTLITSLPRGIEKCRNLEVLNISDTKIKELPTVIFKMENLLKVEAKHVLIEVLSEDFVKLWLKMPDIFKGGQFQKMVNLPTVRFAKPPNEIVRRGPEACRKYYRALGADDAVNSSVLNVTIMGETGAGKSSLIHSIKDESSILIDPSDRTVVVDTLEVKHKDVLLKIADFGGDDIYEMTCPLFLKSTKQVAIVAVKLSEYNGSNHGELVTKWLTTAVTHMKSGSVVVVATQSDLCTESEVKEKMTILKENVEKWIKAELSFWEKFRSTTIKEGILVEGKFHYFNTSSLNMQGLDNVKRFLMQEARSNRSILPKHWIDVYKKMDEETDRGTNFITTDQYQNIYKESIHYNPFETLETEESMQCLQFLHDSGMVLWYGEKHANLRKIIFHDPLFLVSVLQYLFRHDLKEVLKYDHEQFRRYFVFKIDFEDEVSNFTQTGILNPLLLKCIWKQFGFSQVEFDTMVEMLTMLDLCYIDGQNPDSMLRLPWFVKDGEMDFLKKEWPEKLPTGTLQYSLSYCFCHQIPGVIYERFCVRLQRHLLTSVYPRKDRRDGVFAVHNAVKILFQRHNYKSEPCLQIHLRSSIESLSQLQKLCLALHYDIDSLCKEYSGLYINRYLLCPHCLLTGAKEPMKRRISDMVKDHEIPEYRIPCNRSILGSDEIPPALIFLRLIDTKCGEKHLKEVQDFCCKVNKDKSLLFDGLLRTVSNCITDGNKLHSLGNGLGLTYDEISSIQYNCRDGINHAGYQVLIEWRKKKSSEQMSEAEMKEKLKTVLLSKNVGMNQVVSEHF